MVGSPGSSFRIGFGLGEKVKYIIKKIVFFIFITVSVFHAQRFSDQVPQIRRYEQKEIYDSVKGIWIYNKLIEQLGGDSIKYTKAGYNHQGWGEDYYVSGKLLHRGYYIDGKVIVFKNFFENGKVERSFVNPDPLHCTMEIYYENGQLRSKVSYFEGKPVTSQEYFSNGVLKSSFEKEPGTDIYKNKMEYYPNGALKEEYVLKNKEDRIYQCKKFTPDGKLSEQGAVYLESIQPESFRKKGNWVIYDKKGKKKVEKYP